MAFDGTKIIMGAIAIIIGVVMLPVISAFKNHVIYEPWTGATGAGTLNVTDSNISSISGLSSLLDLIIYGFTFGIVGLGIGLIYIGFKKK